MKEQIPLEPADIKKLRRQLMAVLIFPLVVIGMFSLFASFLFNDGFGDENITMYVMVGFFIFFFGIIGYMVWSTAIDLRRGIKERVSGKVTDKRLHRTTTRTGTGSGSGTKTRINHYLYLDGEEFSVDYRDYSKVKVGMDVVMDRAPRSKLTLALEIKTIPERDNVVADPTDKRKFLEKRIPHTRYSSKDFEALERIWRSGLKRRVFLAAPFAFIGILLLASGLWGFAVLLFPLWLVPIYQLYKLLIARNHYRNNKFRAHKQGFVTVVEDKLTITSNRSSNANRIKTTHGTLTVDTKLYDILSVEEGVTIFKTQFGDVPLSVVTSDGVERYLV